MCDPPPASAIGRNSQILMHAIRADSAAAMALPDQLTPSRDVAVHGKRHRVVINHAAGHARAIERSPMDPLISRANQVSSQYQPPLAAIGVLVAAISVLVAIVH